MERTVRPAWDTIAAGTLADVFPQHIGVERKTMSVDERSRLQLAEAAKRTLGDDEGITLMELLPPVGWADVATKHDLAGLESRIDARFDRFEERFAAREHELLGAMERELSSLTWKLFAIYGASMGAMIGALVAVAKL
jgi:hypothetical protein